MYDHSCDWSMLLLPFILLPSPHTLCASDVSKRCFRFWFQWSQGRTPLLSTYYKLVVKEMFWRCGYVQKIKPIQFTSYWHCKLDSAYYWTHSVSVRIAKIIQYTVSFQLYPHFSGQKRTLSPSNLLVPTYKSIDQHKITLQKKKKMRKRRLQDYLQYESQYWNTMRSSTAFFQDDNPVLQTKYPLCSGFWALSCRILFLPKIYII
jgi:hypothetical protein